MIAELKLCAEQNYRCQKPVKHISVAFAPEDGKQDYWTVKDVADKIREELGYGDHQFMVVRHDRIYPGHDRTHNHDHSGIDLASHDYPSLSIFIARLQRLQIDPKFRIEDNVVKGISYKLQNFQVRGCKLHNASLPKLLSRRISFDPERDSDAISMANRDEIVELEPKLDVSWNMTNIRNYIPKKMKQMLDQTFDERESHIAEEAQSTTRTIIHTKLEPNSEQTKPKEIELFLVEY
jgi:hypothetical protein